MAGLRSVGCALGLLVLASAMGCDPPSDQDGEVPPGTDPPVGEDPAPLTTDKLDVLFVVDNSISMADKQAVLAPSVRAFLSNLINPACVDGSGVELPAAEQPSGPDVACPAGSTRSKAPVHDLHVGIISSSLGDLTSGGCGSSQIVDGNDQAHLVARAPNGGTVPTYQGAGYLVWDPQAAQSPPGEADVTQLLDNAVDMVVGVGQLGCGYEMPLEATYRFLADPAPYETLDVDETLLVKTGLDEELLAQRAAFVRPDSVLSVIMLSDENDCSMDVNGQGFLSLSAPFYKATSACQADPNDACCTSCALPTPDGCVQDAYCTSEPKYTSFEDNQNLKCFHQKERYGVDFLYPAERYANALSLETIDPAQPDLAPIDGSGVPNPLFTGGRPVQFVSFAAIVGVPWHDLAVDPTDPNSGLKTTAQMEADGSWAWMVGDNPADPFMQESVEKRTGNNPATGAAVDANNPINGGDRTIPENDWLQFACIFGLEQPVLDSGECGDCLEQTCESPVCDGTIQIGARAMPGIRQLEVVRAMGDRGIAGSVCPVNMPVPELPGVGEPGTFGVEARGYNGPVFAVEQNVRTYLVEE